MSRNTSKIDVTKTDATINSILLAESHEAVIGSKHTCRFNQNEDQFIVLRKPLEVPHIPVHHQMDNREPPPGYLDMIASLASFLMKECPDLASGTSWYFDPVSIHTPSFYRVVRADGRLYLYHLLIDLACRPLECEIVEQGSNAITHAYRTDRLYFESDYYPLLEAESSGGKLIFDQRIPFTWKGESGEGYMIHGIWMDADINKFFSKLVLPRGKRNHPFYPVTCKQHCVTMNAFGQGSPEPLHRIRSFLEPSLGEILAELQDAPFSDQSPLFRRLKDQIPRELSDLWANLTVTAGLNDRDQKEYNVEF
jgi:hypothetical protein